MILVENVSYTIDKKIILQDVSLELDKGGVMALIGPNGAGKSTLLSLMARVLPLQSGRIAFDALDIAHTDGSTMARKVSILQQHTRFMSRLTVGELLMFARFPYHRGRPKAQDYAVIDQTLAYFKLGDFRRTFLDELSGGQRQRALVAMVFAQDTDYILLDEPLNNLDMHHARHLMGVLRQAVDDFGKTIVIVLHDINYAAHYADCVVAMQQGRVVASGRTDAVLTAEGMSALYGVSVEMIEHQGKRVCVYF